MTEETSIGGERGEFQPTLWTTVLKAKDATSPERRQALESLIQVYWKPVYFFIRRRGNDVESSKDLTQSFFAAFLEKDFLKRVSPEKGKFRSFLLASLTYFLSDEFDRSTALKRGGGFAFVRPEDGLQAGDASPEETFFTQWAVETMAKAVSRLKAECSPEDFALLTEGRSTGLSTSDRKNRLHQMRLRLRAILRDVIRPSVELESDIDDEVSALFSVGR
jgi:DNA-directed RNA polymerase specialized sigma24 family protein